VWVCVRAGPGCRFSVRYREEVDLPVMPPVSPMLCKPHSGLPPGDNWLFDPKFDGFRSIVFRDGDEIVMGSRNEKPLTRYFPELVESLRKSIPDRCVLDGEIIVSVDGVLDFDALSQRIHPADSRVRMLAEKTPAQFVAFDLLALDDQNLMSTPLEHRRVMLERALINSQRESGDMVHVTPATRDRAVAADWFVRFEGAGLDGMIAKDLQSTYQPDKRTMVKIKHERTADCVVSGFRFHKNSTPEAPLLGSMLLGIFDAEGRLNHVGVTASFTAKRRAELIDELAPLRENALQNHPWAGWVEAATEAAEAGQRLPGAQSRWNATKDLSFEPVRCERVVEVAYDHLQSGRFRHATTFKRWRNDRDPSTCTYDQLEEANPFTFADVLAARG
jgi:ATP-dependent DNA ligase